LDRDTKGSLGNRCANNQAENHSAIHVDSFLCLDGKERLRLTLCSSDTSVRVGLAFAFLRDNLERVGKTRTVADERGGRIGKEGRGGLAQSIDENPSQLTTILLAEMRLSRYRMQNHETTQILIIKLFTQNKCAKNDVVIPI
jgi:hypothetical protein